MMKHGHTNSARTRGFTQREFIGASAGTVARDAPRSVGQIERKEKMRFFLDAKWNSSNLTSQLRLIAGAVALSMAITSPAVGQGRFPLDGRVLKGETAEDVLFRPSTPRSS
jgi:hypothetical protein